MTELILVLNCGSSSIKFALFPLHADCTLPRQPLWGGKVNAITSGNATWDATDTPPTALTLPAAQPYHAALAHICAQAAQHTGANGQLVAVAHRVVHGGSKYFAPVRVCAQVLADLHTYIPLAPLHQPFALEAVGLLLEQSPDVPQVACFDTAFHHTMPVVEQMLPLNWAAWQRGVRRYGFHGLSYQYMAQVLPERYGDLARGHTIVAHIGSGASLCAMHNLQSVATTLGFSALDGLMMGTRCGAIDPGAVIYLMEVEKLSLEQVGHMLYHESGLLGISGISSDPRVLLQHEASSERARASLDLYVRRMVREIGALAAALGGLDLLVFTAGVGENNATIRQRVVQQLKCLGMELDATANARRGPIISTAQSRVTVAVEPTNEEWVAATLAAQLLGR